EIPLTTNGKIDRKALPNPTQGGASLTAEYVEPESELEIQLAEVWQSLLEQPQIGINHDFFDLGGDSVSAIQTITHINQLYEIEFPIPRFFDSPTISGLAEVIEEILMAEIDDLDDEEILHLLSIDG
ncbi:MAG: phosphopantetheine-binding protein, partial [Anaerolineae bacterium]